MENQEIPLVVGSAPHYDQFGEHDRQHVIGFVVPSDTIVPLGSRNILLSELIQRFIKDAPPL